VKRETHTREALVTLLWPEMDPSGARAGLLRNLSVLRKAQAMEELDVTLLTVEGEGDTAAAKEFLDKYTHVAPDLQALLDQANSTGTVEFVPMSVTE
jgi:DNA-binding SARP family transcriptional activator